MRREASRQRTTQHRPTKRRRALEARWWTAPPKRHELTDLGCPDCRGVLAACRAGDAGLITFACRVGHAFSFQELVEAKEIQVEEALWMTVEIYDELSELYTRLAELAREDDDPAVARAHETRSRRARETAEALRAAFEADGSTKGRRA
jgi:two-component system chemotaxis response regulator CheB